MKDHPIMRYLEGFQQSGDPKEGIATAEKHRAERLEKYKQSAILILSVEKTKTIPQEKEKAIVCKSFEKIFTEIDDKIKK